MASNQQKKQTDNRQCTLEARYVIFIKKVKNFSVIVPPKPDRKYSHTNSYICAVAAITQDDHRSQLELGRSLSRITSKSTPKHHTRHKVIQKKKKKQSSKWSSGKKLFQISFVILPPCTLQLRYYAMINVTCLNKSYRSNYATLAPCAIRLQRTLLLVSYPLR